MQNISPIMAAISHYSGDDISNHRLYEQELPQDLWIEIFIRASVESLLRVKCVCAHWRALISNPSFTKKHLEFQKKRSKDKGCFLLQHSDSTEVTSYVLFDAASVPNVATSSWSRSDCPHYSFHNTCMGCQVYIEGPVNGLYCVYGGTDRIVIWNPATKEVSFLPLAGECLPGEHISYESRGCVETDNYRYILYGILGFGTDSINEEDYKVVMICVDDKESDEEVHYRLLYTTNTNTWRILEEDTFVGFDDSYQYSSNNTFLNGIYYWFDEEGVVVVTFDMGKEIFGKISAPNSHYRCQTDLVVHNDCITLLHVNKDLHEIDIWQLITEESIWIKKNSVVIEVRGIIQASLGFWKNDDEMLIVIVDSGIPPSGAGQTVLYNTTTREITNVGPRGFGRYFIEFFYYESLVSLSNNITKYRGNHTSCLDAIWHFLCGDAMQDVIQQLEEL